LRLTSAIITVFVIGFAASPASAATITLLSGDGETWVGGAPIGGGAGTTVVVAAHPLWRPAGAAQWVSYADTGFAGSVLTPASGISTVFTVFESFVASAGSILNMKIWADDTARVLIDGVELIPANFSQSICAAGSIGCEPDEFGSIVDYLFATSGIHTVSLEVFQVGTGTNTSSNPFGLLYEGTVDIEDTVDLSRVPEPAALALFGLGLVFVARRIRRTSPARTS
jgi:hypothetical protein